MKIFLSPFATYNGQRADVLKIALVVIWNKYYVENIIPPSSINFKSGSGLSHSNCCHITEEYTDLIKNFMMYSINVDYLVV